MSEFEHHSSDEVAQEEKKNNVRDFYLTLQEKAEKLGCVVRFPEMEQDKKVKDTAESKLVIEKDGVYILFNGKTIEEVANKIGEEEKSSNLLGELVRGCGEDFEFDSVG